MATITEDYKEKLKEALNSDNTDYEVVRWIEQNFPELKESEDEDEKIRKELIQCFSDLEDQENEWYGRLTPKKIVAWLEKQGEQNTADKVEPKFHEGEWIIKDNYSAQQVKESDKDSYTLDGCISGIETLPKKYIEKNYHLWTIQDAKDGDVLTTDFWTFIFKKYQDKSVYYYCAASAFNNFSISDTGEFDSNYVHPATKEQRETLMKVMTDAGYTFDFEKKELKKIEQSPAWSEEDKAVLDALIRRLEGEDVHVSPHLAAECLKSLKERVGCETNCTITWKPSDEQMEALKQAKTDACGKSYFNALASLYVNLKGY